MAKIECANCANQWDLGAATTNRCPSCEWITEIYYDKREAEQVRDIYNEQTPPDKMAGVCKLIGINGYSVSFPDAGRLAEVAKFLFERSSE
jgi:hypothetical protein